MVPRDRIELPPRGFSGMWVAPYLADAAKKKIIKMQ
jgi:hypothetical protein